MAGNPAGGFKPQEYDLSGLQGISEQTVGIHKALYSGYVNNTNAINSRLAELAKDGKFSSLDYAELTRRLGFEYNGMILHEYYFASLKAGGVALDKASRLAKAIDMAFGSFDAWMADFRAVCAMRGIGWAVLFQNADGHLVNQWVTLHNDGNLAGYSPVLVLDLWEHAFLLDYKPAEKGKYVDSFFANLNWPVVGSFLK